MAGQRSWLCKLLRDAMLLLETILVHELHSFETISGTQSFDLEFVIKVKYQVICHGCVSCPGRVAVIYDDFGTRADVISGRYPVPGLLTLKFTLEVKCQVKCHGCVSCSGMLAIIARVRPF